MANKYLSVQEVAGLLSVGPHHVLTLIHSGRLPAVTVSVGRKARWRSSQQDSDAGEFVAKSTKPVKRRRAVKPEKFVEYF